MLVIGLAAPGAFAQDHEPASVSEPAEGIEPASAEVLDPRFLRLRALLAETLDVAIDPQSLFPVPLADEDGLQVEAFRLRALIAAVEGAAAPPPSAPGADPPPTKDDAPEPGGLRGAIGALDPALWRARVELDKARLDFYSLSRERRDELLRGHAERQEAAKPKETEDERRAREFEADRQRALEAARLARTEAERLIGEELTRQVEIESQVESARDRFRDERAELKERRDTILGWQRRAREAKTSSPEDSDATYDALRRTLFDSRDELSSALAHLASDRTEVPSIGADPLVDVPPDVSTEHVYEGRARITRAIAEAKEEEGALRGARASALQDEIVLLNRERLGLLPHLSAEKRGGITGFTVTGMEQARAEVRHLRLVLRYHQHVVRSWISSLLTGGSTGLSPWGAAAIAIPWALLAWGFVWGRRRTPRLLQFIEVRLAEIDRAERRTKASPQRLAASFLRKIHRPVEWLIFFVGTLWLVPKSSRELLEIQLFSSVIGWVLGGALAVNVTNAVAAGPASAYLNKEDEVGTIRLRSLRLVGWTVVTFALLLALSTQLVGRGTIYSWVFALSWFAAIPVFLVLVRWWRETVFERIGRVRKKTRLQDWILTNQSGWKSFLAAMIGAVHLFSVGLVKVVRNRISGFDLSRRAHAYLFRRELDKFVESSEGSALQPLRPDALEVLHPEREFTQWLRSPNDELLERLVSCANRGGVYAVIGSKGIGKSSLLRRLREQVADTIDVACSAGMTADEIRAAARTAVGDAEGEGAAPSLILLDDAHALLRPVIGGLATFDEVISFARNNCSRAAWILAFDASMWPFLNRARDERPLFDEAYRLEPWDEAQIGALLEERSMRAGIAPAYDDLLDRLPRGADDLDRIDALAEKKAGYERMLWDHVRGNPGMALEAWRTSLGEDDANVVHVRPLQVPDSSKLELLPDSSLFILRAVLQMAPVSLEDVAEVTRLSPEQVRNAFRFGEKQGFLSEEGGRMCVNWRWRRSVLRLLERRYFLVNA